MGVDTLTEFRNALTLILDNRTDIAGAANVNLDRWINQAYRHVSNPRVARHRGLQDNFTIALVLNDIDYDISDTVVVAATGGQLAGIHDVTFIEGTSAVDNTLTRRKLRASQDVRTVEGRPFSQGPPHRYAVHGESGTGNLGLIIDSQPSAAEVGQLLLVNCWRYPAALAAGGDVTVIGVEWDEVILMGAAWRGWRDLNQPDRAIAMKENFADLSRSLATKVDVDAEDSESQFQPLFQPYGPDGRG